MSRILLKMEGIASGVTESGRLHAALLFSQRCNLNKPGWLEGVDISFKTIHGFEVTLLPGAREEDFNAALTTELAKPESQRKGFAVGPQGVKGVLLRA